MRTWWYEFLDWPRALRIATYVAIGLVLAAAAYAMTNLHLFPGGGTASSLPLGLMIVAILANFGFGILAQFLLYTPSFTFGTGGFVRLTRPELFLEMES